MENKVEVTQEELKKIQDLNAEFGKLKSSIGDIELQKQSLFKTIDFIREEFSAHEKMLIEKYGADSVINIQIGEVTKKQD